MVRPRPLDERDRRAVRAMNAALVHRGPDAAGELEADGVMLAMRRLSIIDVEGAAQPLWNEDRTIGVVVNGEIYNYLELREELARQGHTLATRGDGETIVHAYEELGLDCVQRLRGMFAFALWDGRRRRLLLARDRMGEKPLYFFEADGALVFASELRALLGSGLVPFELDPAAVDRFFHYAYVPDPCTPVRGVHKLPPGCVAWREAADPTLRRRTYWRLQDAPALRADGAAERIRAELEAAVEIGLRSDVPVGVALSGGVDSSALAALAARRYPGKLRAFTVGYPGRPPTDERDDARRFAEHLGIPLYEAELDTAEMAATFERLVWWKDDPIADISGYGYYAVSRLAREHGVPVLLQGQGGDELFWGYAWVREAMRRAALKRARDRWGLAALPRYLRLEAPAGWAPWQIRLWLEKGGGLKDGWALFRAQGRRPAGRLEFYDLKEEFAEGQARVRAFYTPDFCRAVAPDNCRELFTFPEPPENLEVAITALIAGTFLLENGVAQGDRLSMASSVEMRLPFLDYRFVETVVGLRKQASDWRRPPKFRLAQALADVLPPWVLRRPKRGFSPPIKDWYEALLERYGSALDDGFLVRAGVLSAEGGRRLAGGLKPWRTVTPLWFKALVLELWCRQAAEQARAATAAAA